MTKKTFKRYELKYLLTPVQYEIICAKLAEHMNFDNHCKNEESYKIYNIYFDTIDDAVIRRSLDKPYYKEKLRLRSYKMPLGKDDMVFLELKKKIGGIVAKRRAILHYNEAMNFVENGIVPIADNYQDQQVLREIADFLNRYPVFPKVYISYERIAFFGKLDGKFRVSFDKNIRTRRDCVNLYNGDYGTELLTDGNYLMEIKCSGAVPMWLTTLLSQMKIYATSFSKYGTEYKRYRRLAVDKVAA
ncbi:MAG: polyphosphate polymerase domain-containing protein [Filifactoraceae bacterium]